MALSEKKAITDKKHLDKLDKMKIQPYKEEAGVVKKIEVNSSNTYPNCYYISAKEKKELKQLLRLHIQSVPLEDRAELERRLVALIHEAIEEAGEDYDECLCRPLIDVDE